PGTTPTIKYAKDQTNTSAACAAIKTDTVAIITVIRNSAGCDLLSALTARATHTSIVITNAWIAMLMALTPPPTKSCRNMSPLADMLHRIKPNYYTGLALIAMSALPLIPTAKADFGKTVMSALPPKSGHVQCTSSCPLWANSGH